MASENTSVFPASINAAAYNKRQVSSKPPVDFKPSTADPDDPKAAYTVTITLDDAGLIKQSVPRHSGGNTEDDLKFLQMINQLAESKGIFPTIRRIHADVDALKEKRALLEMDFPIGDDKDLEVTDDDSDDDQRKKKKKDIKKITKGALYIQKRVRNRERLKKKRAEESSKIYELINMLNRCLDTTQSTAYQAITKEVMRIKKDWTD